MLRASCLVLVLVLVFARLVFYLSFLLFQMQAVLQRMSELFTKPPPPFLLGTLTLSEKKILQFLLLLSSQATPVFGSFASVVSLSLLPFPFSFFFFSFFLFFYFSISVVILTRQGVKMLQA